MSPGSVISHYRIISRLGAGGMGEVYLAHDTHAALSAQAQIDANSDVVGGIGRAYALNGQPDSCRSYAA